MAHILVVEDDPSNQVVMHKALSKIGGHDVTVTEDVQLVLRLARAAEVDRVVMDVSLANSLFGGNQMDGLAITRLLKADARPGACRCCWRRRMLCRAIRPG